MMGALLSLLQLIPTYNDGLYMIDIHKTVHDSINGKSRYRFDT